ncbi:MAG: hypothetical protein KF767_01245 [Bdellovibrionaceae bacterium]|nr:hypothetical protein [Pseudobdellovibrionaceae bacterium]
MGKADKYGDAFGTARFDRAVHSFARDPVLALPFLVFSFAVLAIFLPPTTVRLGLGSFGGLIYGAVLAVASALYLGFLLTFVSRWQLRLLEQIEKVEKPDPRRSLRSLLSPRELMVTARLARTSLFAFVGPLSRKFFAQEARYSLELVGRTWKGESEDGARIFEQHEKELREARAKMPLIPFEVTLAWGAAALVFTLLPQSFMTTSVRWMFFPLILTVGFSVSCAWLDWAAIWLRHREWARQRLLAEKERRAPPKLGDIRGPNFLESRRRAG